MSKTIIIIGGISVIVLILIWFFGMGSRKGIESYPYTVNTVYDEFEIRTYESTLFTSVKLNSSKYEEVSGKGFSVLAGYIFGGNDKKEKISMTSPVAMSLDDSITMMFMVPKEFNKESLPKPNDSNIKIEQVPEKTVAAIRFSGWANNNKIEQYKNKLKAVLDSENIDYSNRFYFLGYNPPYDLVNRRNEIIVELINNK